MADSDRPTDSDGLDGKVILVTGAAHGLGASLVDTLAGRSARVLSCDLDAEAGSAAAAAHRAEGRDVVFQQIDLTEEQEIRALVEAVGESHGRLDGLVNNARPFISLAPFPDCLSDWDLALSVMAKAPAVLAGAAVPLLEASRGSIVNVSSTNARLVSQQPVTYHAAKAALVQITRCLAVTLGPRGIRVNAVSPGLLDLPDRKRRLVDDPINRAVIEATVPLRRAGVAEDTCDTVAFLLGERSRYINGEDLTIDGGLGIMDQFENARAALRAADKGGDSGA